MDEQQEQFLRDEFFSLTLMATVQRANVYSPGANDGEKERFRKALRRNLEHLESGYRDKVPEEVHIQNIGALAEQLSRDHAGALAGGCFRFGTAQKALNLYLKYLWCIGIIAAPPHCPFDYQVTTKLPGCQSIRWTALNSEAEYRRLVAAAKVQASGIPLPDWELTLYNRVSGR